MESVLKRECLTLPLSSCEVVPALLDESIGDYAAIAVAAMGRENESKMSKLSDEQ